MSPATRQSNSKGQPQFTADPCPTPKDDPWSPLLAQHRFNLINLRVSQQAL
jgi:hypothetical protein